MDIRTPTLLTLLTLALLSLIGCGRSEIEAPNLETESPYLCSTVNDLVVVGEQRQADRVMEMSLSIMSREYGKDSLIERFYNSHLTKNPYKRIFRSNFYRVCESSASLGINDAATLSLTQLYQDISNDAGLATCNSFNNGMLSFDDIMSELLNPTVGKSNQYLSTTKMVLKDSDYGSNYIENNLVKGCEEQPESIIVDVAVKPLSDAGWAIVEKQADKEKLKKEEENIAREKQRVTQFNMKVREFSKSIFFTGEASCARFSTQNSTLVSAENGADISKLREGVRATLTELAKGLLPYQKLVFDSLIESDVDSLSQSVARICNEKDYSLLGSLMRVGKIYNEKGAIENDLISIKNTKRDDASYKSLRQFRLCKANNFYNALCFDEANTYYSYYLIESEIEKLTKSKRLINSKITGESNQNKVNYEKVSAYRDELQLIESKLFMAKERMIDLEKEAISTEVFIEN